MSNSKGHMISYQWLPRYGLFANSVWLWSCQKSKFLSLFNALVCTCVYVQSISFEIRWVMDSEQKCSTLSIKIVATVKKVGVLPNLPSVRQPRLRPPLPTTKVAYEVGYPHLKAMEMPLFAQFCTDTLMPCLKKKK